MPGFQLTARHIRRSLDAIASTDAAVARALAHVGYPEPRRRPQDFATLLRIIVGQQVSVTAASTIYARLTGAMRDEVAPERLLRMRATTLQRAGLSQAKIRYARALARALADGELELAALPTLPDEQAMQQLQAIPGLGEWSAQLYLMFSLGRPDLWPRADIGVLRGLQRIEQLATRPTPNDGAVIAERFRPHRSALALLAWKCAGASALGAATESARAAE